MAFRRACPSLWRARSTKNPPHHVCRNGEKVRAIPPTNALHLHEAEEDFVTRAVGCRVLPKFSWTSEKPWNLFSLTTKRAKLCSIGRLANVGSHFLL